MTGLSEDQLKKIADLDARQIEKLSHLDRSRLEEISRLDKTQITKRLDKIKINKIDTRLKFKKRIVSDQRIKQAEDRFLQARKRFDEAKLKLDERRQKLRDAIAADDDESIIDHAKQGLLRAAEAIIAHLEKVKNKVLESEDLDEERANSIIADLDAKIAEINDAKVKAEAATTKEEIRDAAKSINAAWKKIKVKADEHAREVVNGKVRSLVKRSEQLEKKLDRVLAEMEERGIETESIDGKVAMFSDIIANAREKLRQSEDKFREAKATGIDEEKRSLLDDAKALAREAHDSLKEAHNLLKEIIREVKASYKEVDFETEEEDELIEIEEEDEEEENEN